jgi:ferredoxin-NADP reductase
MIWLTGSVVSVVRETPQSRTIALDVPGWPGHDAGQHVDVRAFRSFPELDAPRPGRALRSYAIASAPGSLPLELTVQRAGRVSSYLVDDLREGDRLQLRGPLGADFRWQPAMGGPLLLIAGGPGIAPLRALLRHHRAVRSAVPVRLLYSVRDPGRLVYAEEILRLAVSDEIDVNLTYTRQAPPGWNGYRRRIDADMLAEVCWGLPDRPIAYVCGPSSFVDDVSSLLVGAGYAPGRVHAERFGPALDGNAVAGLLHDVFGREMTGAAVTCPECGGRSLLARTSIFRGAGTVLRCPVCGGRVMVVVERDGIACVDTFGSIVPAAPVRGLPEVWPGR